MHELSLSPEDIEKLHAEGRWPMTSTLPDDNSVNIPPEGVQPTDLTRHVWDRETGDITFEFLDRYTNRSRGVSTRVTVSPELKREVAKNTARAFHLAHGGR